MGESRCLLLAVQTAMPRAHYRNGQIVLTGKTSLDIENRRRVVKPPQHGRIALILQMNDPDSELLCQFHLGGGSEFVAGRGYSLSRLEADPVDFGQAADRRGHN